MGWLPAENDIPFDVVSISVLSYELLLQIIFCLEYSHRKYYCWRFDYTAKYCREFNTAVLRACVPVENS